MSVSLHYVIPTNAPQTRWLRPEFAAVADADHFKVGTVIDYSRHLNLQDEATPETPIKAKIEFAGLTAEKSFATLEEARLWIERSLFA